MRTAKGERRIDMLSYHITSICNQILIQFVKNING